MNEVRVVFIGAGNVNFGGGEGPWDHASRFERIAGVQCVGVADPDLGRARAALEARQAGRHASAWRDRRAYADWREMVRAQRPDAAIVGLPPNAHGGLVPPLDIELTLAGLGVHMLVEKPLGVAAPAELEHLAGELDEAGVLVSVGYMFRYSRAVQQLRDLLDETPGGPRVFLARYDCAYSEIAKRAWWDVQQSGGPIVEQATHFVDLARYLCGEANLETVQAVAIAAADPAGLLRDTPLLGDGRTIDADVPPENRHPRATLAHWRFASGALGSLSHGTLLHGRSYAAELEVWGDGLRAILSDPYGQCRLGVRRPGQEAVEWLDCGDDDPYQSEDQAFIDAIREGSARPIRSRYADALKTYALTWQITRAAGQPPAADRPEP